MQKLFMLTLLAITYSMAVMADCGVMHNGNTDNNISVQAAPVEGDMPSVPADIDEEEIEEDEDIVIADEE